MSGDPDDGDSPGPGPAATPTAGVDADDPFADMTAEQTSLGYAVVLALVPGVVVALVYALAWAVLAGSGLPGVVALGVAGAVGGLAMSGYILYQAWLGAGLVGGAIAYTDDVRFGRGLALAVGLAAWVLVALAVGETTVGPRLLDAGFGWVPTGLRRPFSADAAATPLSGPALVITAVTAVVVQGVFLPVVEELYFRGYVLPRLDRLGAGAPVIDAALFAVYYLWAPWSIPARFLAYLPLAYAVWRTRNVVVAVTARLLVGLLTTAAGVATLAGIGLPL